MKKFFIEERIPAVVVNQYVVIAESEEAAYAMVENGEVESNEMITEQFEDGLELECYDSEDLP